MLYHQYGCVMLTVEIPRVVFNEYKEINLPRFFLGNENNLATLVRTAWVKRRVVGSGLPGPNHQQIKKMIRYDDVIISTEPTTLMYCADTRAIYGITFRSFICLF